jgi:lipopolysaccharide/colanic/teichoic acid biosynthesis glycosyltransferase
MTQLSTDLCEDAAYFVRAPAPESVPAHGSVVLRGRPAESAALTGLRARERNYRLGLVVSDALAAGLALFVSLGLSGGVVLRPTAAVVALLIVLAAKFQGLYDRDELVLAKSTLDELPRLFNLATLFALLVWLSRHFTVVGAPTTRDLLVLWILLLVTLAGGRMLARRVAARISPGERCVMLGEATIYARLAARIRGDRHVDLIGWVPLEDVMTGSTPLEALVAQSGVQRIIIAPGDSLDGRAVIDVIRAAKSTALRVSLLPGVLGTVGSSAVFDDLGGIVLLGIPRFGLSASSALVKRTFDVLGTGALAILTSPLLLVAALVVKRGSPGPAFFRQVRVGREGKPFTIVKLRTMTGGSDPRVTREGRWLRRTHFDELPQLINVLRNEMSLVGPRPLVLHEDERITGSDRRRLHLTPGITGQWQILGARRAPLTEMVKLDYLYVANWSLWGDVKIIARTIPAMVGRRGQ